MAGSFANLVQLAFKSVAFDAIGRGHKYLLDDRLGGSRGGTDVGQIRFLRDIAPAQMRLSGIGNQLFDPSFANRSLRGIGRQENQPGRETPRLGKFHTQVLLGDLGQKLMRQAAHDARTVTRIRLATTRAAVIHVLQNRVGINHVLVTGNALDVRDETDTAGVLFVLGVVQTLGRWEMKQRAWPSLYLFLSS